MAMLDSAPGVLENLAPRARVAAEFLRALAHESRLIILCHLAEKERSVGELEEILGIRQPAVSQQLARLRGEGLVDTRRDGKTIYYRLASEEARVVMAAIYQAFCGPKRRR